MDDTASEVTKTTGKTGPRTQPMCAKCQRPVGKMRRKRQRMLVTKHQRMKNAYCWKCKEEVGKENSTKLVDNTLRSEIEFKESTSLLALRKFPAGIANMGNTCYLGASLQVLLLNQNFLNWLAVSGHISCKAPCLHCAFINLNAEHKKAKVIHIEDFINTLKEFEPFVAEHQLQHDAHEVLTKILNKLDEECLEREAADRLHQPICGLMARSFGFYEQAQSRCIKDHHWLNDPRKQWQHLLSVNFPSVQEAFQEVLVKEKVHANCTECGENVSKEKWVDMLSYPPNLLIQLGRFVTLGIKNSAPIIINKNLSVKNRIYELRSIILHEGQTPEEGHYTSVIKLQVGKETVWCKFNDSQVTVLPPSTLDTPMFRSSAYVLIYDLKAEALKPLSTNVASDNSSVIRPGRAFTSQMQGAIFAVFQNIDYLREMDLLPHDSLSSRELTAKLLGISPKSVARYLQKMNQGMQVETPGKKRKKDRTVNCDSFTKIGITNLIYSLRKTNKHFNVKTLLSEIKEKGLQFNGSTESLRLLLREMGFRYRTKDNRWYLMEQPHIVMQRIKFVQKYKELKRKATHKFLWLDETWIFRYGSFRGKEWRNSDSRSSSVRASNNGQRYIVQHCGGIDGWVAGASNNFRSKCNEGDYHGEMNGANFEKWLRNQLVPFISQDTIIIMDNAAYHKKMMLELHKQPVCLFPLGSDNV